MLRETALDEGESQLIDSEMALATQGANQRNAAMTTSLLPSKNMAGTMTGEPGSLGNAMDDRAQELNELNMNPQELGQLIVSLQDEIKIIKLQLENLPGYDIGEVPAHLLKLKTELEKTFESLEKKNELLVNSMSMNFGATR